MALFHVKSVENANFSRSICRNLHRPKKISTSILVAFVTNIRYGHINYLIEGGVEGYLINVLIMTKVMIMLG